MKVYVMDVIIQLNMINIIMFWHAQRNIYIEIYKLYILFILDKMIYIKLHMRFFLYVFLKKVAAPFVIDSWFDQ